MNYSNNEALSDNSFDDSTDSDSENQESPAPLHWRNSNFVSLTPNSPKNNFISVKRCQRPILFFEGIHKKQGFNRKSCDNLICMKCDVLISRICNMTWIDSIPDYLFFRSYFGNKKKIQTKMKVENGKVAFFCGCRGIVVDSPSFIKELPNAPKWICNGCNDSKKID